MTRAFFCAHVFFCAFWFLPPTTHAQDSYDPRVCFYEYGNYHRRGVLRQGISPGDAEQFERYKLER